MSEQKEPSIHGGIGGPHPNWLLWYRKTHGCTLAEARAAGFKKLENPDAPQPQVSAEPSLTYPDGSGPTVAWVKWYQSENNCALKPAVEAARAKMKGE